MSASTWRELISVAAVDGATLGNSAVATSLLPGAAKVALLPNFFDRIGKKLRFRAAGRISTLVTAPGTFTFDLRFKDSGASTVIVWNGGVINLNAVAQTNASWELEAELDLRAQGTGTGANLLGIGKWASRALVGAAAVGAGGVGLIVLPDTAPAAGTGFDSTLSQIVDLFGTWSVANAANSITLHQYALEASN